MTTTFETRRTGTRAATLGDMATVQTVTPRARYESRPGRCVVVAASLAGLEGPIEGRSNCRLWLFWSSPGRTFDLDDPDMRRGCTRPCSARPARPEDLTAFLDGDTLIALWPTLYLPGACARPGRTSTRCCGAAAPAA